MTRLAGTMGLPSEPARHAAVAFISGHLVALLLIGGAIVVVLLALPVLGDVIFGSIEGPMTKSAPAVFTVGLGTLILGLFAGAPILDIIGAGLMGLVLLGALMVHY
ncbi:MAG: hypothetical protein M3Y33_14890 [Actinomycetota bacterium]|nr:hypothetical protein [Actinomycetota bacterium]